MIRVAQALWDQMRAELRAEALPQLSDACRSLLSGTLGPLTEHQIEDLGAVAGSISKLTRRMEGEPIDWSDHGAAAHALRGPLNSTIGFSRIMLKGIDGPTTEPQREALETIYTVSRLLLTLFNLLLDALLLAGESICFDIAPVCADEILKELVALGHALADNRHFVFAPDVTTQIAEIVVRSDAKRLKQALSALLATSAKHMGDGGTVALRAWRGEDELLIQLENHDCQLPPPLLAGLSTLLTDSADCSFPYDAHLRLGLAWRLLAEMGGNLEAERTAATCTFKLTLPIG